MKLKIYQVKLYKNDEMGWSDVTNDDSQIETVPSGHPNDDTFVEESKEVRQGGPKNRTLRKQRPNEIFYFTNRFEIGLNSVYPKLEECSHALNGTQALPLEQRAPGSMRHRDSKISVAGKRPNEKDREQDVTEEEILGYITRVKVKSLDQKGCEVVAEDGLNEVRIVAAAIKMVNVPTMFDLGVNQVNPCESQLNLNMIDDVTYHEVIRKELKKDALMRQWKIENTKVAIEALHHNLFCNEIEILFDGYSTVVNDNRCLYTYESRDKMRRHRKKVHDNLSQSSSDAEQPFGEGDGT